MPKEKAAKEATSLVNMYGSLPIIQSTSIEALVDIAGVSKDTALMIKLLGYVYSRSITDKYTFGKAYSVDEIKEYLVALYMGIPVETVYCLCVDYRGRLLSKDVLNVGIVNQSDISARMIIECACRHKASGVILCHNHPKGVASPSDMDIESTQIIRDTLGIAGIDLVAHYLVAGNECVDVFD